MQKERRISKVFRRGLRIFISRTQGIFKHLPDKQYLGLVYYVQMGKKLNIENPKAFTEKLQWLKLYNRDAMYTKLVDKCEVKKYIAKCIGEEYVIPELGVWDRFDQIDFDSLPDQFVLKCTHDSGGIAICKDKRTFDKEAARKKIEKSLKNNYYYSQREWPYKGVKPRIIAEKYMVDESGTELKDYKFLCFGGVPKIMLVGSNRGPDTRFDYFDMEFNHLPLRVGRDNAAKVPYRPAGFDKMAELAARLSSGLPHVRVDFYDINGHIYFGEMTFTHYAGIVPFEPEEWDYKLGEWLELPERRDQVYKKQEKMGEAYEE